MTVRSRISRRIASTITASASSSTALVGSSRISTGLSFRKARAIAMRWRWPPESWMPLAHLGVIGLREPDDELVGVRCLRRRDQVALARPRPGVSNVLGDAGREEHRILRYYRELTAEILEPEVPEVNAVEPDLTLCRVVEPREQADQRAL